jgi:thymidine phosphorylase
MELMRNKNGKKVKKDNQVLKIFIKNFKKFKKFQKNFQNSQKFLKNF